MSKPVTKQTDPLGWLPSAFGKNVEFQSNRLGDFYRVPVKQDYVYLCVTPATFLEQEQQILAWLKENNIDIN